MTNTGKATVTEELQRIPPGAAGSSQNVLRAVYAAARSNSLGSRPEVSRSADSVLRYAIGVVRNFDPQFIPDLLP